MAFDFKAALKKKWVRIALIFVAVGGAFLIFRSMTGSSAASTAATSSTGLDDAQAADLTSENEQASAIQASEQEQSESDQTGLAATQDQDSTQISLAGIQLQGLDDQLTAQTTQNSDNDNATVSLANIAAGEQTSIASTEANENMSDTAVTAGEQVAIAGQEASVEGLISNNQTNVALAQTGKSSGGGCFITTAVCAYDGEADDCYRLRVLRNFRDLYMLGDPLRAEMVNLYYAVAPVIVDRLDSFDNESRDLIYKGIRRYIDIAVAHVSNGDDASAAKVYIEMMSYAAGATK